MRIATVAQSRLIDERAQAEYELSGEVLMEAAGVGAAREIEVGFLPELRRGEVGIVCGPGNNGADGLVVARHLHSAGYRQLRIYLVGGETGSPLFARQLGRCRKIGLNIIDLQKSGAFQLLDSSTLLIDALFGTGLHSSVEGVFLEAVNRINRASAPVVSLDTPSGLDADRGVVLGEAVRADLTVTFGLAKPGFFVSDGPSCVGRLRVLPIGFSPELMKQVATSHVAVGESLVRKSLPKRRATSNKTNHGHSLVLAGRSGMWGAALLAASAAYRVGSGYVTLASFEDAQEILREAPEVLTAPSALDEALWAKPKWKAVGLGPGLGIDDRSSGRILECLERLRTRGEWPVVVDADAITAVARHRLFSLPKNWVLTPHAGELARILDVDAKTIEADRYRYASEAARLLGCHVLLKGYRTVLSDGERSWVILSGNAALAKAGTGDVLTGMITGLMAQGLPTPRAAAVGAYLHGRIADEWVRAGYDRRSLQASDLREILPRLLASFHRGKSATSGARVWELGL